MTMADLDSLAKQAATGDGRGGKRPGAGRPRKDGKPKKGQETVEPDFPVYDVDDLLGEGPPPPLVPDPVYSDTVDDLGGVQLTMPDNPVALFAGAKARKEAALAAKAELDFRIKAGMYLPREAVRAAIAKAFQAVAQSMRSIPDNLERKLGLSPEITEQVSAAIDESMGDLSHELENVFQRNYAASAQD